MPEIAAFQGIIYNSEFISNFESVLCPPYDVIPPAMQESLYATSPYNAIRLELPKEENKYDAAAERLKTWLSEGILKNSTKESIYPYHQTFTTKDGVQYTRKGFIARCKLYEFEKGVVLPHEKTLSGPKKDRLQLFIKTGANISPIFGLYADQEKLGDKAIEKFTQTQAPFIDAMDYQNTRNKVWELSDPEIISTVKQVIHTKQMYIADGHHRYETAINYRNLRQSENPGHTGNEAYNFIMMYMTNIFDEGLVIFPTHRLIHSLESFSENIFIDSLKKHFEVRVLPDKASMKTFLKSSAPHAFGIVMKNGLYGIKLVSSPLSAIEETMAKELKMLDVVVLHQLIVGKILGISQEAQAAQTNLNYSKDFDEVYEKVSSNLCQIGIVMNPTSIQEVEAVSQVGEVMPQKSTFFFPKVLTGVVIHSIQ
ncbi:MAG: DUF1015 domain-containing protein [Chloroherpetonaceae bacterium]|nr:DUF1015 domain-containing protein [Chloroherpetonaceae bacterium]